MSKLAYIYYELCMCFGLDHSAWNRSGLVSLVSMIGIYWHWLALPILIYAFNFLFLSLLNKNRCGRLLCAIRHYGYCSGKWNVESVRCRIKHCDWMTALWVSINSNLLFINLPPYVKWKESRKKLNEKIHREFCANCWKIFFKWISLAV